MELTQEYLKSVLEYDPETGVFKNRVQRKQSRKGAVAGSFTSKGYWRIKLLNKEWAAHRLAWLYMHGCWPAKDLDHKNRKPDDNRIANLREATTAENKQNVGVTAANTSGYIGVTWNKKACKWQASIRAHGKSVYLGLRDSAEAAHAEYLRAEARLHSFQPSI